jgi:hypothetical protein
MKVFGIQVSLKKLKMMHCYSFLITANNIRIIEKING